MQDTKGKQSKMVRWVAGFEGSGQTLKEYCTIARMSIGTYYYWKRKSEEADELTGFQSIHVQPPSASVYLRLPSGVEIHGTAQDALLDLAIELDVRYAKL